MMGDIALLGGFHDCRGVPGHLDRWPPHRVVWWCPSPWLAEATLGGEMGYNARFYFAPIEDEL